MTLTLTIHFVSDTELNLSFALSFWLLFVKAYQVDYDPASIRYDRIG